jgi:hypothetical protein
MIRTRHSPTKKPTALPAGDAFGVHTKIVKATGKASRYASDAVRVLPAPPVNSRRRGPADDLGVILEATDGHQAVCIFAPGNVAGSSLVSPEVFPTRQVAGDVVVQRNNGHWRSSEGRIADAHSRGGGGNFPPIGDVLPELGRRPFAESAKRAERRRKSRGAVPNEHVVLGIDLDVLRRTAEAFGTSKLTLFIPVPVADGNRKPDELHVNKPVAICPASSEGDIAGVGVAMPLTPQNGMGHYMRLRDRIVAAEKQVKDAKTAAAK